MTKLTFGEDPGRGARVDAVGVLGHERLGLCFTGLSSPCFAVPPLSRFWAPGLLVQPDWGEMRLEGGTHSNSPWPPAWAFDQPQSIVVERVFAPAWSCATTSRSVWWKAIVSRVLRATIIHTKIFEGEVGRNATQGRRRHEVTSEAKAHSRAIMALPQRWKWRTPGSHVPHRTFCDPAHDTEVAESLGEQAVIRYRWCLRNRAEVTNYADASQRRRFQIGRLAASAAVALLRRAVRDPDHFERWIFAHGTATTGGNWSSVPFPWGSGAGWGSSRGNTMPGWAATPELTTRTLGGFLLDAGPLATTNTAWGAPSWGAGAGSWGAGAGSWGAGAGSWGVPTTGATVLGVASTSPRTPKTPGKAKRRRLRRKRAREQRERDAQEQARYQTEYRAWAEQRLKDANEYTGCY
ncbi:hypothetical protein B0H12DRAFT_1077131 [Mycena haematopus]|nr:hypothetical protein B0H12DRAFT_1077131 [Mycena haematopus]